MSSSAVHTSFLALSRTYTGTAERTMLWCGTRRAIHETSNLAKPPILVCALLHSWYDTAWGRVAHHSSLGSRQRATLTSKGQATTIVLRSVKHGRHLRAGDNQVSGPCHVDGRVQKNCWRRGTMVTSAHLTWPPSTERKSTRRGVGMTFLDPVPPGKNLRREPLFDEHISLRTRTVLFE